MNDEAVISGLTIKFDKEYDDFMSFLNETRDPIYRAIYNAFKDLHKTDKITLKVQAHVDDTDFESLFEYTKSDIEDLKEVILPYFEQKEDYEACLEIIAIHSSFMKN